MAKPDYMPNDDEGKARLFVLFRDQIGRYLPALEIAPDDPQIVQQAADATRFRALVDFARTMQSASKAWTAEKDFERDGGASAPAALAVPSQGADFPPPVPPGLVSRFRKLVQWIKSKPAYNEAMGLGLGVEAQPRTRPDLATIRPVLAPELIGSRVEVGWTWQALREWLDSIEIQVDRGDGLGWVLLTMDTTEGYVDTAPLPATPATWKYRGIYRISDDRVGQWSNEASLNLGG